jgi:hypothetical protein
MVKNSSCGFICTYFAASFKTVNLLLNLAVAGYAQPFNLYGQNGSERRHSKCHILTMLGQILIWLECLELLLELRHLSWIVTIQMTLSIMVGIVTKETWFNYQQGQKSLLQSIQISPGPYPASYSVGTGELSVGV